MSTDQYNALWRDTKEYLVVPRLLQLIYTDPRFLQEIDRLLQSCKLKVMHVEGANWLLQWFESFATLIGDTRSPDRLITFVEWDWGYLAHNLRIVESQLGDMNLSGEPPEAELLEATKLF